MVRLESYVNSLNFKWLYQVADLTRNSKTCISFWGQRLVSVPGYEGFIPLEFLAKKVVAVAQESQWTHGLLFISRSTALDIVGRLQKAYLITDVQIQNSNFLTRLFVWIREFSLFPFTTRFHIEESANPSFRSFDDKQFVEIFGPLDDKPFSSHPASDGWCGGITVREEVIRALARGEPNTWIRKVS